MDEIDDIKAVVHDAVQKVSLLLGDVTEEQIWSKARAYKVASARQLVMWYLVRVCNFGISETANAMGKHHATIIWGVRQAEIMIDSTRAYDRRIRDAAKRLKEYGEKTMFHPTMTDRELVRAYYDETEPITRMKIAEGIHNEELRARLVRDAKVMYYREDDC